MLCFAPRSHDENEIENGAEIRGCKTATATLIKVIVSIIDDGGVIDGEADVVNLNTFVRVTRKTRKKTTVLEGI